MKIHTSGDNPINQQKMRNAQRENRAIKIMVGDSSRKDFFSVQEQSPYIIYERETPVAVVNDASPGLHFRFYFDHYNNPRVLLDAVNFAQVVEGIGGKENWKYGTYRFWENNQENMQIIPKYAIPRMNPEDYSLLYAKNNTLVLDDRTYQTFRSSDGGSYVISICKKRINYACTEEQYDRIVNEKNLKNCQGAREARDVGSLLSSLAKCDIKESVSNNNNLRTLEMIGIQPGFFKIIFEGETYSYYLSESGRITHDII